MDTCVCIIAPYTCKWFKPQTRRNPETSVFSQPISRVSPLITDGCCSHSCFSAINLLPYHNGDPAWPLGPVDPEGLSLSAWPLMPIWGPEEAFLSPCQTRRVEYERIPSSQRRRGLNTFTAGDFPVHIPWLVSPEQQHQRRRLVSCFVLNWFTKWSGLVLCFLLGLNVCSA